MDLTTVFCPTLACSAPSHISQDILNNPCSRENKTLSVQVAIGQIPDTLLDHVVTRDNKDKG